MTFIFQFLTQVYQVCILTLSNFQSFIKLFTISTITKVKIYNLNICLNQQSNLQQISYTEAIPFCFVFANKTMQKSKNRNSLSSLQTKIKYLKESTSQIKMPQKSLNKSLKFKRSSTTHLNQYSKLLLLQKSQDTKHLGLLKRDKNTKNILQSVGVTLRQKSIKKEQEIRKVDNLIQIFKKKVSEPNLILETNNYLQRIELTQTTRIIKTSQANSRKSLHKKRVSMGKLCLGKNIVPDYIPSKQQRLNPFYEQPRIISESMITSKGVFNLINAGVLPSEYDFLDILNNKYEPIVENTISVLEKKPQQIMKIQEEAETFMTNPTLMNQYEEHKKISEAELIESAKSKNPPEQTEKKKQPKIRKTKLKKVKKVKDDPLDKLAELLVADLPVLTISNGKIEKNQNYRTHLKLCLKQGSEIDFFELVRKMEEFVSKYKIKKILFKSHFLFVKNLTESYLLHLIENYKIYGLYKTVRSKQNNLEYVALRAVHLRRMKKMRFYLKKLENLKKYYRMRKLYHECVDKRYNFYKYRLGSFAEEQRKYMQNFQQNRMTIADYHPKVQIHILTKQSSYQEEITYYKLRERLRAHLMRLANNKANEIILLVDPVMIGNVKEEMNIFFGNLERLSQKVYKVTNHLPKVHVFQSNFKEERISYTGRIYFGINENIIKLVKQICKNQKPVVIPYESSKLLPFICETLNANFFGGTYTKDSIEMIFQQEENHKNEEHQMDSRNQDNDAKFKKIQVKHTFQTMISKLKNFELANYVYEDKSNIYELFSKRLGKQMPYRIQTKNKNEHEFYEELVAKIIFHKESTKWIFKLGKGKFSRGMAIFETNDLKIFQQNRRKSQLSKEEIIQISKLMSIILKDKIILSHSNLMEKKQFLTEFFTSENSYVEEFIQNSHKICIFGKILPNGHFVFMGSYKKHYTNNIGYGASYPAEEVNEQVYEELRQLSKSLFEQNVFGYVTFEFLFQQKSKNLIYLDFTPNLDEYSSLYFMYESLFKAENMYSEDLGFNELPKNIFYCPFLDNNGNNFESIEQFLDECRMKKIWYNPATQQGQRYMFYQNDPSMLSLLVFSGSELHSIKMCIDAISFLVETGGKFYQFDKKYMGAKDLKTDGLYMMDILWKLRQTRKKLEGNLAQQQKSLLNP